MNRLIRCMKNKQHKILTISHHIFLTKEERYAIFNGEMIDVVGHSLPVWLAKNQSKPIEEVFCKYSIENNKNKKSGTILLTTQGYRINLPQIPKTWKAAIPLTDNEWLTMSEKELSIWYKKHSAPKNAKYLLDIVDGGGAYLRFKFTDVVEPNDKKIKIVHYCELNRIETLRDSLIIQKEN